MKEIVHGLWIEGPLSSLELLTIRSFLEHGFSFHLWTYTPQAMNAPASTLVRDANEIISSEKIFSYHSQNIHGHGKGSYAGFSDIFRYKLLYEQGGIWADMDITCLKPFKMESEYFFRFHHKAGAVGNFMKCPVHADIMKWCYDEALQKINKDNTNWMLPIQILNEGITKFGLSAHIQRNSNPDSFTEVIKLLSGSGGLLPEWDLVHWMNEEFRRLKISKDICLPDSVLDELYHQYHIPHRTYGGFEKIKNKILLNRYYYLLLNIRATLQWYANAR